MGHGCLTWTYEYIVCAYQGRIIWGHFVFSFWLGIARSWLQQWSKASLLTHRRIESEFRPFLYKYVLLMIGEISHYFKTNSSHLLWISHIAKEVAPSIAYLGQYKIPDMLLIIKHYWFEKFILWDVCIIKQQKQLKMTFKPDWDIKKVGPKEE